MFDFTNTETLQHQNNQRTLFNRQILAPPQIHRLRIFPGVEFQVYLFLRRVVLMPSQGWKPPNLKLIIGNEYRTHSRCQAMPPWLALPHPAKWVFSAPFYHEEGGKEHMLKEAKGFPEPQWNPRVNLGLSDFKAQPFLYLSLSTLT